MGEPSFTILTDGVATAQVQMDKDERLLSSLNDSNRGVLRFYDWREPCLTYGYFVKVEDHINLKSLEKRGIPIARRPTGGGILFHGLDFAFTVAIPSSHPKFSTESKINYQWINQLIAEALQLPLFCHKEQSPLRDVFCMARPTQYDLVVEGKKIGGCAQRRTRSGLIQQTSIFLFPPDWQLMEELLLDVSLLSVMRENVTSLFSSEVDRSQKRKEISDLLMSRFCNSKI